MLKKWPETELEYFHAIEALGGYVFYTNHDLSHGHYVATKEIEDSLAEAQANLEQLANELEKFNVIRPTQVPEVGQLPPAPEGKIYYGAWYQKMKRLAQEELYNSIICSACPYSRGVEGMIGFDVPCGMPRCGVIYRLPMPYLCHMLRDVGEASFYAQLVADHGEAALEKFKAKTEELKKENK